MDLESCALDDATTGCCWARLQLKGPVVIITERAVATAVGGQLPPVLLFDLAARPALGNDQALFLSWNASLMASNLLLRRARDGMKNVRDKSEARRPAIQRGVGESLEEVSTNNLANPHQCKYAGMSRMMITMHERCC
jgi:hypothetical protein